MSFNTTQDRTMDSDDQREGDTKEKHDRQKHEIAAKNGSQCSPITALLISTGAIKDVDNDGNLDLINLYTRQTVVQDGETNVHSTLSLQRLELRTHDLSHTRVPLHSNLTVIKTEDCGKCDGRSSMKLLNDGWLGYMGLRGDSIYDIGHKN
ncbi:uncharacterized protein LOC117117528 [Anneissia japonica]|uniref:uncharacterized protein LOC117117528 n=1 Tax=Anneissia japonica TaxID=1529436 RepID=UPI00142557F5|nr:uncharacterized protein LOC117117528 [Anneissia japonica]